MLSGCEKVLLPGWKDQRKFLEEEVFPESDGPQLCWGEGTEDAKVQSRAMFEGGWRQTAVGPSRTLGGGLKMRVPIHPGTGAGPAWTFLNLNATRTRMLAECRCSGCLMLVPSLRLMYDNPHMPTLKEGRFCAGLCINSFIVRQAGSRKSSCLKCGAVFLCGGLIHIP